MKLVVVGVHQAAEFLHNATNPEMCVHFFFVLYFRKKRTSDCENDGKIKMVGIVRPTALEAKKSQIVIAYSFFLGLRLLLLLLLLSSLWFRKLFVFLCQTIRQWVRFYFVVKSFLLIFVSMATALLIKYQQRPECVSNKSSRSG